MAGTWTATLDYSYLKPGDEPLDPTKLEVRVAMRSRVGAAEPAQYRVPLKVFYVGAKCFDVYNSKFDYSFIEGVYGQAGLQFDLAPLQKLDPPTTGKLVTDYYDSVTAEFIRTHAKAEGINVFMIEDLTVNPSQTKEGSALGVACMPGPRGFLARNPA